MQLLRTCTDAHLCIVTSRIFKKKKSKSVGKVRDFQNWRLNSVPFRRYDCCSFSSSRKTTLQSFIYFTFSWNDIKSDFSLVNSIMCLGRNAAILSWWKFLCSSFRRVSLHSKYEPGKQRFQFKIKNNGKRLSKLSQIIIVFIYLIIYLQYNFCAKVEHQYSELSYFIYYSELLSYSCYKLTSSASDTRYFYKPFLFTE